MNKSLFVTCRAQSESANPEGTAKADSQCESLFADPPETISPFQNQEHWGVSPNFALRLRSATIAERR
jgi:hypothetical protein